MAAKAKATAITHEWQTQDLASASPTSSIASEGADATTKSVTATVRLGNKCQINNKSISVSGTQQAVNPAGRKDELAYQMSMISLELKRDMEAGILQNDCVGSSQTSLAACVGGSLITPLQALATRLRLPTQAPVRLPRLTALSVLSLNRC